MKLFVPNLKSSSLKFNLPGHQYKLCPWSFRPNGSIHHYHLDIVMKHIGCEQTNYQYCRDRMRLGE